MKEPIDMEARFRLIRGLKPYYERADRKMKGQLLDLLIDMTEIFSKRVEITGMYPPGWRRYAAIG